MSSWFGLWQYLATTFLFVSALAMGQGTAQAQVTVHEQGFEPTDPVLNNPWDDEYWTLKSESSESDVAYWGRVIDGDQCGGVDQEPFARPAPEGRWSLYVAGSNLDCDDLEDYIAYRDGMKASAKIDVRAAVADHFDYDLVSDFHFTRGKLSFDLLMSSLDDGDALEVRVGYRFERNYSFQQGLCLRAISRLSRRQGNL